mmetsp:Transcript_139021/g.443944  ORF Transcript_139021/g.443944 Transcript_139021/m.443944 type:complete len:220 (-) Transcript_139021:685-1344(-)
MRIPIKLIFERVVPKATMDASTSNGRRSVLIMLWVTGDVFDNIRIDAMLKTQTRIPVRNITYDCSLFTSAGNLSLSNAYAAIKEKTNAPQCSSDIKFNGSSMLLSISHLLKTPRKDTPTFEIMADQKPHWVKDTSVFAATPTPMTTSSKLSQAFGVGVVPKKSATITAVKKGSAALIVWVNAMFTSETETFAKATLNQCSSISGTKRAHTAKVSGGGRF